MSAKIQVPECQEHYLANRHVQGNRVRCQLCDAATNTFHPRRPKLSSLTKAARREMSCAQNAIAIEGRDGMEVSAMRHAKWTIATKPSRNADRTRFGCFTFAILRASQADEALQTLRRRKCSTRTDKDGQLPVRHGTRANGITKSLRTDEFSCRRCCPEVC